MKNKLKINAAITTAAVIICAVLLNIVVGIITDKMPLQIDFTKEKVYDFSDQTKSVMSDLKKDVQVYALIPDDVTDEYLGYVKEYLAKYESLSDRYSVKYIDPYTEPAFLSKYSEDGDSIELGSIIVTSGDKFRVISYNSLFEKNSYDSSVSIDMETKMTSAVIYVTGHGKEIKICFTTGHEETPCANFMSYLTGEGYKCSEINISKTGIPEDTSVLVIAGAANDFTLDEINAVDNFSDNGGHLLVTAPLVGLSVPENLKKYFADWGIEFGDDQIVENDSSRIINTVLGTAPAPVMQEHEITEKIIKQKIEYISPETASIKTYVNNIYGAVHTPLLTTSGKSVSTKAGQNGSIVDRGPFDVGVISVRMVDGGESKMFTLGSLVSVEAPVIIGQSTYANSDFLLNAIASMTESTNALEIRAKKVSSDMLTMTETQVKLVHVLLLYILPVVIFIIGIIVWLRRRYL